MDYVARVPAPPLDRFIDDIYCMIGAPRHRRMNVPPMPSAHLFVNLGDPARLSDPDSSVPPEMLADGWFMGLWTRRFLVEYPRQVRLVGELPTSKARGSTWRPTSSPPGRPTCSR